MARNPYQPFITDRRNTKLPSTPIHMTHPVGSSSLGRALQSLGAALSGIGEKEQAETDKIQATEAITRSVQRMDDTWGAYAEKSGKDAYDSFGATREELNKIYSDAKDAAPNSRQRAAISQSLSHSLRIFDSNIMRHRVSQIKKWRDDTSKNAIAEFGKQAIAASDEGYEERFDTFVNSARDEALSVAKNHGLVGEDAQSHASAQVGQVVNEAIKYQVARGNLKQANAIYGRYKSSMDAGSVVAAEAYLSGRNMDVQVEQMLDKKFPMTAAHPEVEAIEAITGTKVEKSIQDRLPPYSDKPHAVKLLQVDPDTGKVIGESTGKVDPGTGKVLQEKAKVGAIKSKPSKHDAVIEAAAKKYKVDPDVMKRFMQIESGGRAGARTGSYHGLFQLSKPEFRKHGGGNIYSPKDNASAAASKIAVETMVFEKKNGRKPTATELYLQHQQGVAGAAAHRANPNKPAWENMYSTGEGKRRGKAWAKAAIWGNIPDSAKASPTFNKKMFPKGVASVTSKQFMEGWRSKIEGGAAPKTKPVQQATGLPPLKEALQWSYDAAGDNVVLRKKLEAAIVDRYRAFDQKKADAKASIKRRSANVISELTETGTQSDFLSQDDFNAAYGAQEGAVRYDAYLNASKTARVANEMKSAPITEHEALLETIKPEPGDPLYAEKAEMMNKARIASSRIKSGAAKDSAAFAVSTSEKVRESLDAAMKGGQEEAGKYVDALREEQRRLKIPPGQWRTLPSSMTQNLAETISDTKDKTAGQVLGFVQQQEQKWGENWDDIVREMKGKLPDALYVASQPGVEPTAASSLIAHADVKVEDILKSTTVTKDSLRTELSTKLSDFTRSMSTTPMGREESATIYDQTLKLSAVYAAQGKTAEQAAEQAYEDVIGRRYDFSANYRTGISGSVGFQKDAPQIRIPKKYSGVITSNSFEGISRRVFHHDPEEYGEDFSPKIPSIPGTEISGQLRTDIENDSYFATLPDDSGVALTWRGKLMLRQDGTPLIFTWDKIMELDAEPSAEDKAHAQALESYRESQREYEATRPLY